MLGEMLDRDKKILVKCLKKIKMFVQIVGKNVGRRQKCWKETKMFVKIVGRRQKCW